MKESAVDNKKQLRASFLCNVQISRGYENIEIQTQARRNRKKPSKWNSSRADKIFYY